MHIVERLIGGGGHGDYSLTSGIPQLEHVARFETDGKTAFLAGWDGKVRGVVAVADTVRDTSAATIAALRDRGVDSVMLTGDNQRTAEFIATEVGIDRVLADVLPGEKASEIERLQREGHVVGFVGDGLNDAPAQARALAVLLRGLNCHVNLIPINPSPGVVGERPSRTATLAFQSALTEAGIGATVRVEKGRDILAACGQLRGDRVGPGG